jgi:hypothetical protein
MYFNINDSYFDILMIGISIFLAIIILQIIIWKVLTVQREIICLFSIMFISPIILLFFLYSEKLIYGDPYLVFILIYSLCFGYVQTYPGFKEDIPSLKLIKFILKHQPVTFQFIINNFELKDNLVNNKIMELHSDGLIYESGNEYHLTRFGYYLAKLFYIYRNIINSEKNTG